MRKLILSVVLALGSLAIWVAPVSASIIGPTP